MINFRGGELSLPTRSEMSTQSFALKRHLGELLQRPVYFCPSSGTLDIPESSLDKTKQGTEPWLPLLSTRIIKLKKKYSYTVQLSHAKQGENSSLQVFCCGGLGSCASDGYINSFSRLIVVKIYKPFPCSR